MNNKKTAGKILTSVMILLLIFSFAYLSGGAAQSFAANMALSRPAVTTASATDIQSSQAKLNGSLTNINGDQTNVLFQWGAANAYNNVTIIQTMYVSGAFSAVINGLSPGATYYFRAAATNQAGVSYGEIQSFTTPWSASEGLTGKHLVFASAYRATNSLGVNNEYLVLGHYDFFDGGSAKVNYMFYIAGENRILWTTSKKHNPMQTPYASNMPGGTIRIPPYENFHRLNASWRQEGDLLKVQIGAVTHEWRLDDAANGFYKLNRPYYDTASGLPMISGLTFSNTIGYGYVSDNVITDQTISKTNLFENYSGELYQNNGIASSPWQWHASGLSARVFTQYGDPDVLGYNYSCPYSGHPNTWCQTSLLLNYAPYTSLLLYNNGGHDFNENGIFDESGHAKQILAVLENGKISKMVFIEYSYEYDGYPIISVGRYY